MMSREFSALIKQQMMKIVDLIWYKLYRFAQKSKIADAPNFGASFFFTFCVQSNIIFVSYTLWFFFEIPFLYKENFFLRTTIIAILLFLLFFFLYRGERGHKIIVRYRTESPAQKRKSSIIATTYFILTILTSVFGGGILRWMKYGYFPL